MTGVLKSHVEAHVAEFMRQQGVREAVLVINNAPCPLGCQKLLPRMLDRGTILEVYAPNGYHQVFLGTGKVL